MQSGVEATWTSFLTRFAGVVQVIPIGLVELVEPKALSHTLMVVDKVLPIALQAVARICTDSARIGALVYFYQKLCQPDQTLGILGGGNIHSRTF